MARFVSKQEEFGHLRLAEVERFEYEPRFVETMQKCAELPAELSYHQIIANEDPNYIGELVEWTSFIYEHELLLPLEQACHDGMLLPTGQRALRLESCPEELLRHLRWFFECWPSHVKSRIALECYLLLRMESAARTGSPEWRPGAEIVDVIEAMLAQQAR